MAKFPSEEWYCTGNLEQYLCSQCDNFRTYFSTQLRQHLEQGHLTSTELNSINVYNCDLCNFETSSLYLLFQHACPKFTNSEACSYTTQVLISCDKCNYTTNRKDSMNKHIKGKHLPEDQIEWFQCEKCPLKYKWRHNFLNHVKSQHTDVQDNEWYHCEKCQFKTVIKWRLKEHILGVHTEKSSMFSCSECSYTSKTRNCIVRHYRSKHTLEKGGFRFHCNECPFKTYYKHVLERHSGKHLPEHQIQRLQCDKCPSKFKYKGSLNDHIKRYHNPIEEKKWLYCEQCTYKTLTQYALKRHSNVHSQKRMQKPIKLFDCDKCPFQTKTRTRLKKHILYKHTPENERLRFHCTECSYKAPKVESLKLHMICKHLPDDQIQWLQCAICPAKFKVRGNLRKHMKFKHCNEWIECKKCGFKSKSFREFKRNLCPNCKS